jgi:hypothetical protein
VAGVLEPDGFECGRRPGAEFLGPYGSDVSNVLLPEYGVIAAYLGYPSCLRNKLDLTRLTNAFLEIVEAGLEFQRRRDFLAHLRAKQLCGLFLDQSKVDGACAYVLPTAFPCGCIA